MNAPPATARTLLRIATVATLAACDVSTPTEVQHPIDLELDFCSDAVPVWFGYENQGADVQRLLPDADGTFRFTATNRVIIGMVWQVGADYHTEIIYATNEQLASMSGVGCLEESGTKVVNGTVAGVGGGEIAVVSMGFSSVPLQSGSNSFSLTNLPDRPLDLVASRQDATTTRRIADRVFIARTQNPTHNGNLPPIDFTSGSVLQPAGANVAISGILSGEFAYVQNNFFSQLETSHSLFYEEGLGNGSRTFAAIPQGELASGDYHDLILLSVNSDIGSVRGAENYFRAPAAQTLALGPVLSEPSIAPVSNPTSVILRTQLSSQLSYNDAIRVAFDQQVGLSAITVTQYATADYFHGTPGTWALQLPDLRGAPGWQPAWELRTGAPINWTVTGFGGRAELLFGARPEDGEFVRYAFRYSDPTAATAVLAAARNARNGSLRSVYTNRLRLRTP